MPLNDVRINIQDGGLGILPPSSSGLHAKIGVCSAGAINEVITITDPKDIPEKFGTGPLANALYDSFAEGTRTIHVVRANGDIAGTIGDVEATKTGTGNMTLTGTPLDSYELVVEIVDPGAKNVATFKFSLDGGDTFSGKITVPTALTYVMPDTGLTLNFTEDAGQAANSFKAGDRYICKTAAPQASVNSANAAIDVLLNSNYLFEYIHVVGPSDEAMWAALAVKAAAAESRYRFIHFLAQARGPNAGETVDQWVNALLTAKSTFANTRVSICAGRFEMVDMGTGRVVDRNGAGIYAGRVSSVKVSTSPGKVAEGPLPGIVALKPDGINDGHIEALDQAGFITFRQYIGLSGFYVTNGRMAAEPISDFQYVELRRPMDKACHLVRMEALKREHAEIDPTNLETSFKAIEAQLTNPLNYMVAEKEIARGRVIIPLDQDVLATSKIRLKVRIVPMGTLREIEVEMGYENPFQSA